MSVHYTDFFRSYRLPDATLLRKVPPVIAEGSISFFSFLCACCLLASVYLDSAIKHCSANVLARSRTGSIVKIKIFISNNIEIKE